MNPALDLTLVVLAVLGALGFLFRGTFRKKKKTGCATGCGCRDAKTPRLSR
jgi:hypothetical protein